MAGGGEKPEVGRTAPGIITVVQLRQQGERGRDGHGRRCRSRTNNTEGRRWGAKGRGDSRMTQILSPGDGGNRRERGKSELKGKMRKSD